MIGTRPGVQPAREQERLPLSRRAKLVMGIAFGAVVVVLAIAPFTLMALPDPHPYRLDSLAGEVSGTFVATGNGYYKLYPYSAPLYSFPADALAVDSGRPTVIVKFRQGNDPSLYAIRPYASATPVAVETVLKDATTLQLTPVQPLQPGRYVITAPRDSVDEAMDTFYFQFPG